MNERREPRSAAKEATSWLRVLASSYRRALLKRRARRVSFSELPPAFWVIEGLGKSIEG